MPWIKIFLFRHFCTGKMNQRFKNYRRISSALQNFQPKLTYCSTNCQMICVNESNESIQSGYQKSVNTIHNANQFTRFKRGQFHFVHLKIICINKLRISFDCVFNLGCSCKNYLTSTAVSKVSGPPGFLLQHIPASIFKEFKQLLMVHQFTELQF